MSNFQMTHDDWYQKRNQLINKQIESDYNEKLVGKQRGGVLKDTLCFVVVFIVVAVTLFVATMYATSQNEWKVGNYNYIQTTNRK